MKIIKYLFNKKYREDYTIKITKSLNYNFDEYEKIYKDLKKMNLKVKSEENLKKSA